MDALFIFFDAGAVVLLVWWLVKLFRPTHHAYGHARWRATLLVALAASLAGILYVLEAWASFDVVDAPYFIVGYASLGLLWITGAAKLQAATADIRFQQDVRDRNNVAAAVAIGGLLLGDAAAYAGGNVGDGPGLHVVLFAALLSTGAVTAAVWLVAACSDGEERITIDHDVGAALRLGALALATGIVAGRAAAGDWISAEATVRDFAGVAWPIVPAVVLAIANERWAAPSYAEPSPLRSASFAAVLLAVAIAYVSSLGPA